MSPETFSSEQRIAITSLLKRIEKYRDGTVVGQVAAEISKTFQRHPFVEMEKILRELGSDTYLIAIPLDNEMARGFSSRLPHSGTREYPFYMWICVNGEEEAEAKRAEIETDINSNLQNLANSGMLVAREGTELSRMSRGRYN